MGTYGRQFGTVAEAYERWRFGYPEAVADAILAYAQPPVRTAVEIGAGTGKATRLIAGRGIEVTAVEPDPGMIEVLRTTTEGLPVTEVMSTYEDLEHPPVDLLYAAAAFHWTADEGRWERAAALLRPGGTFANLGGPVDAVDPGIQQTVQASAEQNTRIATERRRRPDVSGRNWPTAELETSALFTDVREQRINHRFGLTADAYVAYLGTTSGYLALDDPQRALTELRAELPDAFEVAADVILHLARRR